VRLRRSGFWLLPLTLGCAGVERVPVDPPGKSMTVREARDAVRAAFETSKMRRSDEVAPIAVTRRWAAVSFRNTPNKRVIDFAELSDVRVEGYGADLWQALWKQASKTPRGGVAMNHVSFVSKAQAVRFAEALLAAKQAAAAPGTEEADFAAFRARLGEPRPEMPDAARADKALAEEAFRKKDFTAALYAYGDALEKHPLWPEGQYNAALLAAEVEDFDLAVHHMRRYLALAPDAKDVAASREKLLLWERKAKP
jgi:tetratricopeptide (TPR) repeat protein